MREPKVSVADFLPIEVNRVDYLNGGSSALPILEAVALWTRNGQSGEEIAARLGCSRRKVTRLRTICRERALVG
ncbi:MAG TPA: hypothetical protein VNA20_16265 [Frankiaceae bacterium]|nr:hypothetical protein [Frankiaceae bacterium]